jgi:flavin-dependent dehydrogenase
LLFRHTGGYELMQTDFDAVIVGAGPAGSSAAIRLARAGWSVALIEKATFPRRKVCGECVSASNLPLLDALGIGQQFESSAGPELRRVGLMHGDCVIEADLPAARGARFRWGRALGRETLDTLLLERAAAAGAQVLQPWSIQAIDGTPGNWRCRIQEQGAAATSILHSRVAIDAHGSWEPLRTERHAARAPSGADLLAFKANFSNAALRDGVLPVVSLDGGYGGMVVADGGMCTVACCLRRDRLEACRLAFPGRRAGEAVENFLMRQCRGVREALQPAVRAGPWLAAGPLSPGIRVGPDDGPFRIGNAAGEAHPIIGEGMSMALQSSWLLCSRLLDADRGGHTIQEDAQRDVARRYAAQWRRLFGPRLAVAAIVAHAAMRPASAASLAALVRSWPGILTLSARLAGKTHRVIDPT